MDNGNVNESPFIRSGIVSSSGALPDWSAHGAYSIRSVELNPYKYAGVSGVLGKPSCNPSASRDTSTKGASPGEVTVRKSRSYLSLPERQARTKDGTKDVSRFPPHDKHSASGTKHAPRYWLRFPVPPERFSESSPSPAIVPPASNLIVSPFLSAETVAPLSVSGAAGSLGGGGPPPQPASLGGLFTPGGLPESLRCRQPSCGRRAARRRNRQACVGRKAGRQAR